MRAGDEVIKTKTRKKYPQRWSVAHVFDNGNVIFFGDYGSSLDCQSYFSPVHDGSKYTVVMTATDEQHAKAIEKAGKYETIQFAIATRTATAKLFADMDARASVSR